MKTNYIYEPYHNEIVCNYKKTKGYQTYPYHRHNGCEIYYFMQGNINLYIEENCYHPQPGELAILPPNCLHRIVSLDEQIYERVTINIKESVFERLSTATTDLSACFHADRVLEPTPFQLPAKLQGQFLQFCNGLEEALHLNVYGADIMTQVYLSQLLLMVNQAYQQCYSNKNNLMPPLVKDTMKYIQEHLEQQITVEELSQYFYQSQTSVSRLFKKHTGLTLREYILDCRIEHAKKMLLAGHSVSEACYASGFHDYANFIRSFKKVVGLAPGKYKLRMLSREFR